MSSRSDGDNTAAIVGGVLGTVTTLAIMAVIVMVFLQLKNHGAADIPASTNEAYELSKFSGEAVYE